MVDSDRTVIVAAADERATRYADWLDDWPVETVPDGAALRSTVTPDVAAVVVETAVTEAGVERLVDGLRAQEVDRPVVVVGDDPPAADGVGLRFTEYLVRPLDPAMVREAVANATALSDETVRKRAYLSLAASQAALELELTPSERDESDRYENLTLQVERLRERSQEPLDDLRDKVAGN